MRGAPWLHLSSLGIGTYLGDEDDNTDALVQPSPCTFVLLHPMVNNCFHRNSVLVPEQVIAFVHRCQQLW